MAYISRGVGGRGFVLNNDGYRYQRNWSSNASISWRCFRQNCRAYVKTNVFEVESSNAAIRILQVKKEVAP
jgi:hypothetical protein